MWQANTPMYAQRLINISAKLAHHFPSGNLAGNHELWWHRIRSLRAGAVLVSKKFARDYLTKSPTACAFIFSIAFIRIPW
jgi:hypothetical protein